MSGDGYTKEQADLDLARRIIRECDVESVLALIENTQAAPGWTTNKPTVPGCYWYKGPVWGREMIKMLEVCRDPHYRYLYSASFGSYVDMMDGQWSGPLTPPGGGT